MINSLYSFEEEVFLPKTSKSVELIEFNHDNLLDITIESICNNYTVENLIIISKMEESSLETDDGVLKKVWDFIKEAFKKIIKRVKEFFKFILDKFERIISNVMAALGNKTVSYYKFQKEKLDKYKKDNRSAIGITYDNFIKLTSKLANKVKSDYDFLSETSKAFNVLKKVAIGSIAVGVGVAAIKKCKDINDSHYIEIEEFLTDLDKSQFKEKINIKSIADDFKKIQKFAKTQNDSISKSLEHDFNVVFSVATAEMAGRKVDENKYVHTKVLQTTTREMLNTINSNNKNTTEVYASLLKYWTVIRTFYTPEDTISKEFESIKK